jgi:hypothetical protein
VTTTGPHLPTAVAYDEPIVTAEKDDPAEPTPKPTLEDVQKFVAVFMRRWTASVEQRTEKEAARGVGNC